MDMIDKLRELAARVERVRSRCVTEEGTKNALVMPFIQALGYDVFDPLQVVPEFTADVGIKKGEKVDYALLRDDKPIILFECKALGAKLAGAKPGPAPPGVVLVSSLHEAVNALADWRSGRAASN